MLKKINVIIFLVTALIVGNAFIYGANLEKNKSINNRMSDRLINGGLLGRNLTDAAKNEFDYKGIISTTGGNLTLSSNYYGTFISSVLNPRNNQDSLVRANANRNGDNFSDQMYNLLSETLKELQNDDSLSKYFNYLKDEKLSTYDRQYVNNYLMTTVYSKILDEVNGIMQSFGKECKEGKNESFIYNGKAYQCSQIDSSKLNQFKAYITLKKREVEFYAEYALSYAHNDYGTSGDNAGNGSDVKNQRKRR